MIIVGIFNISFTTQVKQDKIIHQKAEKNSIKEISIESAKRDIIPFSNNSQHDSIISLPFGSELMDLDTTDYYSKLIGDNLLYEDSAKKHPSFPFPEVRKVNYVKFDSTSDYYCKNGMLIDSIFTIPNYQYRLPNIAQYECYYSTGADYYHKDYSKEMREQCHSFIYWFYGYLILYDAKIKLANVLPIYFVKIQDGYITGRNFYIDENYNIQLINFADIGDFEGDEETKTEHDPTDKQFITISKKGVISINEIAKIERSTQK